MSPLLTLLFMLLLLVLLLVASAFCSGCETALFSLSQRQRRDVTISKNLLDRKLSGLIQEIRGLLITLLLGNMLANVLYFVISTVAFLQIQRAYELKAVWVPVMSAGSLMALIIFGEVLPKMFAANLPLAVSRFVALPLWLMHRSITPVRVVISALIITPLARLLEPGAKPADLSTQELEMMLELSQHQGVIDAGEEQLLQQVLSLSQLRVHDLMIPRVDIKAYDVVDPPVLLVELFRATRLERIVVYEDDLDHVVGLAYARQVLLRRPNTREEMQPLVRQVTFVPESQRADKLLIHFRKMGTTMAVVVDEYGGTAGIVTLEDVVEQMIGQISGPYETNEHPDVQPVGDGRWRVSADLPIHEWAESFGPIQSAASVSTLGGLVMAQLGRLPKVGDTTTLGNLQLQVQSMKGARLDTLLLQLIPPEVAQGKSGKAEASSEASSASGKSGGKS